MKTYLVTFTNGMTTTVTAYLTKQEVLDTCENHAESKYYEVKSIQEVQE